MLFFGILPHCFQRINVRYYLEEAETLKLIAIWGEEHIQTKLQECKKNKSIYEKIAGEMTDSGYERSYQQCRDKIRKLKGDYKKEKDRHGNTGEGRTTWEYFDVMDAILGHRPTTRPPVIIGSSVADSAALSTQSNLQDEEEEEPEDVGEKNDELESPSSVNTSTTSLLLKGDSGKQDRKRKRASSRADANAVIDLLEQVMSAQNKSKERMIELEEKRLRMEEWQMEKEALQRREEREFQMQMMRMMMAGLGMHPLSPPPPT